MKVVFLEDVEGTAVVGEVREVANGYARNFLLPRGIAVAPTEPNLQRARSLAEKEARRQEQLDIEAATFIDRLANYVVSFEVRIGETGQLFGSVTSRDVAARIQEATDIEVSQRMVLLSEPIREIVTMPVTIRFTRNTSVDITVDVQPDEESRPIVERLRAEAEAEAAAAERAEAAAQEIASKQAADAAEQAAAEQASAEAAQETSTSAEVAKNDATGKEDESPEDGAGQDT
tara:strand:+ start:5785 stop:6480 length:696 start_codon:yes stop_codon:yes gene_type:complete